MGSAGGSMSSGRAAVRGAFRGRGARAWGCRPGWRRGTSVLQRRCRMVAGLTSAASLWGTWCRVRWVLGGWTEGGMMGWMTHHADPGHARGAPRYPFRHRIHGGWQEVCSHPRGSRGRYTSSLGYCGESYSVHRDYPASRDVIFRI